MHLHYFLVLYIIFCILLTQAQAQHNTTISNSTNSNSTNIQGKVAKKRVMKRRLHKDDKQGKGMMHIVIHKIQPGDPYYKVFDGDEKAARGFTNKIWNRLFNRYRTMLI
ncbi:uncharacterized protein LOC108036200 [Drosophila biarmipes]|uniref:uncharacterized protein LOC108036200 n=1 Tax=Drosophila biarmipes TaxID=125945 RepID=UPI0007E80348|nr:uncharacterized protein LOC108036200 [Drosophila biarmipes]